MVKLDQKMYMYFNQFYTLIYMYVNKVIMTYFYIAMTRFIFSIRLNFTWKTYYMAGASRP